MEQEKSFLEEDSFMDLPPLKRVDQSLALQELGTMFLCDDFGNEIKNQEFGRIMTINKSLTKYNFNFSILVWIQVAGSRQNLSQGSGCPCRRQGSLS